MSTADAGILFSTNAAQQVVAATRAQQSEALDVTGIPNTRRLPGVVVLIKITGSSTVGSNQWKYTAKLVDKGDGYATTDSSDTTSLSAFNWYEFDNKTSTSTVNGISISGNVQGLNPVPNGKVFPALVLYDSSGNAEYWFTAPNEWQVACTDDDDGGDD